MSMDGSPIIDRTPIDNLYLNAGWCYGGFKATPASGFCFAHLIAKNESHPRRARFVSIDFGAARRSTKRAQAPNPTCTRRIAMASLIRCPHCGARPKEEFTIKGAALPRPKPGSDEDAWFAYVFERENPRGALRGTLAPHVGLSPMARREPRHHHS